ncbi:hypothetical protein ACIBCU_24895 [Streptomyces sp. NPDC051064]|uniref:hypothetical protein n=1 Tax=Streptomyces sp. NPDC051064 TaxID=3365641 RepID=UPI0037A3806A
MSQVSIASMLERCVPCGEEARSSSKRFMPFAVAYSVIAAWTAPAASSQAAHAPNATAKQEEARYLGLFESREDSPAGWNADGDAKFDLWSSTPTLPNVAVGEQVAVGKFTPKLDFTLPGNSQLVSSEDEEGEVLDSAAHNPWAELGSVFPDATPSLRYDKSDTSDAGLPTPCTGVEAVARQSTGP